MGRLLLFCATLLTLSACADGMPRVVTKPAAELSLPEALRTCRSAPSVPGPEATQKDVAAFLVALEAARADCKAKHGAVVEVIDDFNARQTDQKIELPE